MIYSFLADLLLVLHLCFILFVMFGGLLVLRRPWLWRLHLPAVAWGFLVQYFVWICPLTVWEVRLRRMAGGDAYAGGFIEHYLEMLIYPDISPDLHILLAFILVLFNLPVYIYIFFIKQRLV